MAVVGVEASEGLTLGSLLGSRQLTSRELQYCTAESGHSLGGAGGWQEVADMQQAWRQALVLEEKELGYKSVGFQ